MSAALDWADGYRAGFETGREIGYGQAEHQMAEQWQPFAKWVIAQADPESPQARETAGRRVRACEAESRREALRHFDQFIRSRRRVGWPR
jgi:hypothetical protein